MRFFYLLNFENVEVTESFNKNCSNIKGYAERKGFMDEEINFLNLTFAHA